jgi:glutamate synthase (NADPH/NADH) large chain/glutamate synthase (ferredoxin)
MSRLDENLIGEVAKLAPTPNLYDPADEHDACGVGFVASIPGARSYDIVRKAIQSVCALAHRGAMDADAKTGDGAGVLTQIPHELLIPEVEALGHKVYRPEDLGVGVLFLPLSDKYTQGHIRQIVEESIAACDLSLFGFRDVPVRMDVLGDKALRTCPKIEHVLIGRGDARELDDDEYERMLYLCRRLIELRAAKENVKGFYVPSFSHRTIVYKGLLASPQLDRFYPDLRDEAYATSFSVYHSRYSTNTFPTWPLAQSFRMLSHNGEINTIRGNRRWLQAREPELASEFYGADVEKLLPILQEGASDSASLDNALEALVMGGRDVLHAILMLVPSAWQQESNLSSEVRAFYEYHGCLNEPWDGPAGLCFSDGKFVGACLDRNGLRPARYKITEDGLIILGSEVGVLQLDDETVVEKGRLAPGQILAVDLLHGQLLRNDEIKETYARRAPYAEWVKANMRTLAPGCALGSDPEVASSLTALQIAAGINTEETKLMLAPMADKGAEASGSMGDDAPLAVLSRKPRILYHYFKQAFAQVTNPPIDPIREKLVMAVDTYCGYRRNWLGETAEHARLLHLPSPLLTNDDLAGIRQLTDPTLQSATVGCLADLKDGDIHLEAALDRICRDAEQTVDAGKTILILSDRGVAPGQAAVPSLLALGAVHTHLIRQRKRMKASIICESSDARLVEHIALLLGYGAVAVNPYLALATLGNMIEKGEIEDPSTAVRNYRKAVESGLLKIMSKMGISTAQSYCGAQIFEAIGIGREVIERCFPQTASKIGGIGFKEIAFECLQRHAAGFQPEAKLGDAGHYRFRRDGESHAYTPPVLQAFHVYVGIKGRDKAGRLEDYQKMVDALLASEPINIRHLLRFKPREPIPVEEVEPVEDIRKRFTTAAMSLGALSPEAHEALAIAMNRIGGKSNSGEGGEDRSRFGVMDNGDSKNSRIKQVASGRFGVTAEYLASATEIEIKMAQGSKPGEGGQISGNKVVGIIAKLRHANPGTTLVSPPPHHDIYSIEDLAQLIYDLKQVNPRAKVCVKLVSTAGVGTIAAGVAKAHADIILISGHDGGTGNSPISSIQAAGSPWELGLAEAQQILMLNGLRNRVTLRTDGGIRTGFDVVIASMLGAEEYNFGTSALIALGCVYVRQCHLNTCPVGVTTQDEKLRAKFKGSPDNVVTYFTGVAEEVRQILAKLGVRSLNEVIGRTDYLEQGRIEGHPKANTIDLASLLSMPYLDDETVVRYHTWERNDKLEDRSLDEVILQDVKDTMKTKRPVSLKYKVKNTLRSIGAQLSGEIAYQHGDSGLPPGTIDITFKGSAGQSFGAFLVHGLRFHLVGEANDYVGKGMTGGEIILTPPAKVPFNPTQNFICGNTVLYGATSGYFYARGRAGERFAVRNSGATAVVQGVGDHGCEYMTNGLVAILGPVGKNFGAGMSGGIAYVLDEAGCFEQLFNPAMLDIERLQNEADVVQLKELIYKHLEATESRQSHDILSRWEHFQPLFWKAVPRSPKPPATAATQDPALAKA